MPTYNLGQVAVISKGAWSSSASYLPLNTVTHNGGSFMAIASNTNKEPGVASGWESYWVATAKGVKTVTVTALTTTTAQVTVTFSDGSSVVGGTFNTGGIPNNSITTSMMKDGIVTGAKLASSVLPANVGIKMGTSTPTTSTISNGQVYLKYS